MAEVRFQNRGENGNCLKFWPYKILCGLLYGYIDGIDQISPNKYVITTSSVAAFFGLTNQRLQEYMMDLLDLGFLGDLSIRHGHILATVVPPRGDTE